MRRFIVLTFGFIFGLACSKEVSVSESAKQESEPAQEPEKVKHETAKQIKVACRASHENPFYCIETACLNAGGKYDVKIHTCDCKNPSDVFNPLDEGRCERKNYRTQIMLDDKDIEEYPNLKGPNFLAELFSMRIYSKNEEIGKGLLFHNLWMKEINLVRVFGSVGAYRFYVEPESDRLSNLIQRRSHASANKHGLISDPFTIETLDRIFDPMEPKKTSVEFFTQDGCAGHCIIQHQYTEVKNHRILEINEYVGGFSIRHQVIVEELGLPLFQNRQTVIEIDSSGSPNLVYQFQDNLKVYARTGELLDSKDSRNYAEFLKTELEIRDTHQNSSDISVVICDAGLVPSEVPRFRVGPRTDKSFWGWMNPLSEQQSFALWEQLSGVEALSEINYVYFPEINTNKHGASVANLATQNTDFSAISIAGDQCFSHYRQWKDNVKPFARVVNVSAAFYYDQFSCSVEPRFKNSIGDPEQPFFWVLSSGNDSRRSLTSENAFLCPQSWGPRSNMIVVTAISADYANTGVDYADIAADGHGYYPGQEGTSFAAPKVARVAALLAQDFPSLTNQQIRDSIMQGARIPKPRLPVRSGGILDEAGARKVAKKFHEANSR